MKGLKADQERWRNARCGYLEYYSDKGASGGGSKLSELLASMNAIKGGGTLQTDLSSLKSGLSLPNNTTYINTVKQLDELKGQQADLEDKIRAARADLLTETDAEKKKSKKEILDQFTTQRTEILGNINNLREENKRVLGPQDPDETECDAILKDMKDKTDELSKLSRSKPGAGSAGSQTLGSPKSRYP